MEIQQICSKDGALIATLLRNAPYPPNLTFYTKDSDYIQVATWHYGAGKHLKAHSHRICERTSFRTNEVIHIKSGLLKIHLFDENDLLIQSEIINKGETIIIFAGGHSYDILEDNTQVLEVKNGPYPGIEADKKVIEK